MLKKLLGWKSLLLSQAGRQILIKTDAYAVPACSMSCFKFLKKWCEEVDAAVSEFWWGQKMNEGTVHWKSWESLTEAKSEGRLGFGSLSQFNLSSPCQACLKDTN